MADSHGMHTLWQRTSPEYAARASCAPTLHMSAASQASEAAQETSYVKDRGSSTYEVLARQYGTAQHEAQQAC